MFTTQFWLIVIGIAQMIGCSWIFSKFQKRAYKREIRSRHSYVLLAKLLAEEEKLRCNISKCNEDGTGEVYLGLPEGTIFLVIPRHIYIQSNKNYKQYGLRKWKKCNNTKI